MIAARTAVAIALAVAGLVAPPPASGQPTAKVHRIGLLTPTTAGPTGSLAFQDAFWGSLRELGWTEGQNLVVERRTSANDPSLFRALAQELVRANVDVIVAITTPATAGAREATGTIPIVFLDVADPVASGFVASVARPGGNVTGIASINVELSAKRLDLLKEAVPRLSRVTVLGCCFGTPVDAILQRFVDETAVAARARKVGARALALKNLDDAPSLFSSIARDGTDGIVVLPTQRGSAYYVQAHVPELAIKHRLPTIFDDRPMAEAGGLLAYGIDHPEMYRRGAAFVDRILRGTRPADLPVEQPTKLTLAVNLNTARALGITMPPSLLLRADQVIE